MIGSVRAFLGFIVVLGWLASLMINLFDSQGIDVAINVTDVEFD